MISEAEEVLVRSAIHVIGDKCIRVLLYGPDNYKAAVVSHYAYSRNPKWRKPALQFARELLDGYLTESELQEPELNCAIRQLFTLDDVPFPSPDSPKFTFIDLFAGIGGFRIAMQRNGGECVFSSEYDKKAQETYYANFGEVPFGDITKEETKKWIPAKFDLLCAGFPCQPFSIAGVSKKNALGRLHGFDDEKQGNLFFHLAEIIEKHRPKAFFLENVKNLVSHDKGNTFKVIRATLEALDYSFHTKVMNGKYLVPQHRERTFIVGFDKRVYKGKEQFVFPELPKEVPAFREILDSHVPAKYTLTDHLWEYLQNYAKKHKAAGNGFGFGLTDLNGVARTMSARYYKDGSEILIPQGGNMNPRRLTPREAARLQGYPEEFRIPVADTSAYKQFGNSVVMPLIQAIGENIAMLL
jgi:DNA (cytosine-5)-methyltransferase 1